LLPHTAFSILVAVIDPAQTDGEILREAASQARRVDQLCCATDGTRPGGERPTTRGGSASMMRAARWPDEQLAPQLGQSVVLLEDTTGDKPRRQFTSYSSVADFPLVVTVSADYDEALAPWLTADRVGVACWPWASAVPLVGRRLSIACTCCSALANQATSELQHLAIDRSG
jgi:hypothetical protein